MASWCYRLSRPIQNALRPVLAISCRWSNTLVNPAVEKSRKSKLSHTRIEEDKKPATEAPRDYKHVYPEFLPNPRPQMRDRLCERLERREMLRRRAVIDIPEFYVGTIMAVTVSDPYAPGKVNRFVGICIQRRGHGLRADFTLRNIVEGEGTEICYDLYCPLIQKIEVLKLEKRLDNELIYLRNCDPIHSTFPFDMEPVILPPKAPVPVNTIKLKLGPRPWDQNYELKKLKGVEELELTPIKAKRAAHPQNVRAWEEHDLMKQYRESINEVEAGEIMSEVYGEMSQIEKNKLFKKQSSKPGATKKKLS